MDDMGSARQRETVVEQFTAQAAGYADQVRRRFVASLRDDSLGVKPWRFPIAIVVGERETVN